MKKNKTAKAEGSGPSTMLLFDIDLTLLFTGGVGRFAINNAFKEIFGVDEAWGSTQPDGKTDSRIFGEIALRVLGRSLRKKETALLLEKYRDEFMRMIKDESIGSFRLMPGIPGLLSVLDRKKRFALGVATGNIEETGWAKLERGRLRRYFRFGAFASDSNERVEIVRTAIRRGEKLLGKKFPKENIFVIGDAPQDIEAAKKAGARSIAVATGRRSESELAAFSPDFVLPDLSDPERFLKIVP